MGLGFLFLFLMLPQVMKCDDNMNGFLSDLILSFRLISPTIVYHGDAPEICFTKNWVLCLNQENVQAELFKGEGTKTLGQKRSALSFAL